MHEMSIAINIVRTLKDEMALHPGTTLKKVKLGIGELSGIEEGSLRFSLEFALAEENWQGVEFEMAKIPLGATCKECGTRFKAESSDFRCPKCGSDKFDLEAGQSVTIDSIIVE
ncbi:MAG TPA: hydrogenase maturation nickel metallochaperone HypA [Planctomycetota bacterium]|nr:hydrogenase maturation nickel metallochaperone HypA [Planctomycetota bacterium]